MTPLPQPPPAQAGKATPTGPRPRLLDLFGGAGGAGWGYYLAGFDVVGVDLSPKQLRSYPLPETRLADVMDVLAETDYLDTFDAVHASPPCQEYSRTRHAHDVKHPDLLLPVVEALRAWHGRTGRPWVVENVPGAPYPAGVWTVEVCGAHLTASDPRLGRTVRLRRHRLFGSSAPLLGHPCGCDGATRIAGVYAGGATDNEDRPGRGGYTPHLAVRRALMGIGWMNQQQLSQAIPPDYTLHLGAQLHAYLVPREEVGPHE